MVASKKREDSEELVPEKRGPGTEVALLAPIIGRWQVVGENAPTAPSAPASAVEGEESYEWMDGDFFILGRWSRTFDNGHHSGVSVLGYEPERGAVMIHNFDNLGYARDYQVAIDGKVWTLTGAHERATYSFAADGESFDARWEIASDRNGWQPLCTLRGRRC